MEQTFKKKKRKKGKAMLITQEYSDGKSGSEGLWREHSRWPYFKSIYVTD